ncbi:Glucomannan 4-beta-mannosyltransferase 2 [Camellia lanceoleosa]|nr:Glucomannan 4-beta-mannosyltransferase 2 [Camellia lanceoleosa]
MLLFLHSTAGTADVWRIAAINEVGGWKDRTIVEDMDLAVRASLKGWKFVYLGDLQVKSELPSTFKAFRFQQHRWSCGLANLFRKMVMEIVRNKKVTLFKKVYVIYSFFFFIQKVGIRCGLYQDGEILAGRQLPPVCHPELHGDIAVHSLYMLQIDENLFY